MSGGVWQAEVPRTPSRSRTTRSTRTTKAFVLASWSIEIWGRKRTPLVDADGDSCGSKCTVTVTITDNDTAGVTVSESSLTVTEEDTTGDTYTIVLDSQPTANVTISIGGQSGTDVTAAPSPMTFTPTNWATPQTVTVTAANDADLGNDMVSLSPQRDEQPTATTRASPIAGLTVTVERQRHRPGVGADDRPRATRNWWCSGRRWHERDGLPGAVEVGRRELQHQ